MFTFLVGLAALGAVDAPITAVTVFSDRARVVRSASVGGGGERVELPLLPDSVDPASIRVEASGVEVRRVDIQHVDAEAFPRDKARALLEKLEALDDDIARARGDRDGANALLAVVQRLTPSVPASEPLKPPPRLAPSGWAAALGFVDAWSDKMQARVRTDDEKLRDLDTERRKLAGEAQQIGGARRRAGWRVTATVGGGNGKLSLTYMVAHATWTPTYDVTLDPEKGNVVVALAGRVHQESGEDWNDASLVLSTAVPATATVWEPLVTWKIGEKERFIPTPRPKPPMIPPAPPAAPPPSVQRDADEVLRERLVARAQSATTPVAQPQYEAPPPPPPAPAEPMNAPARAQAMEYEEDVAQARPSMAPAMPMAPPPMPTSMAPGSYVVSTQEISASARAPYVPPEQVGLAPPPSWQPPYYAPDLPVSLAGGLDLAFPSLRAETIASGGGARRVALAAETWPVSVERRVFPALASDAFLVAELRNPSRRALPGGHADLFVGADPAGVAELKLLSPGEKVVLPLGLDRAIKPIRNVKLVTVEKGVFAKDEITEYTVTIEIANPYRTPTAMHVIDQIPIGSEHVEIKLVSTSPAATLDGASGKLDWHVMAAPSSKTVVSFVYTLRRPKGWRLHQ